MPNILSDKDLTSGFTLIEILVVVSIMLFLVSGAIAAYSTLNQKQTLVSAGQTIKNVLRDAQSRAFTGEKAQCATAGLTLKGWDVDFTAKTIYAECTSSSVPTPIPFSLSPKITLSANPAVLLFTSFPKGANSTDTICLSSSDLTGLFYKINVDISGNISDSNILYSSCP